MEERFYKIGEVAEMLEIEQHTLRYLENSLKLKIKRSDRVIVFILILTLIP